MVRKRSLCFGPDTSLTKITGNDAEGNGNGNEAGNGVWTIL